MLKNEDNQMDAQVNEQEAVTRWSESPTKESMTEKSIREEPNLRRPVTTTP